jgi:thiosulfate dehydrogenase
MKRKLIIALLLLVIVLVVGVWAMIPGDTKPTSIADNALPEYLEYPWEGPDTSAILHTEEGELVRYGRQLISQTALYLGPKGKVAQISNGMNCQNCHLNAGTKPWGNNYSAVASTYPKFRDRSGSVESIEKRINDCIERSLNGKALDSSSRELRAIVAYMHWLGNKIAKGKKPMGSGISSLAFPDRASDPEAGKQIYAFKCARCHGNNGEGLTDTVTGIGYTYPPLWGEHSYNTGAGLFRVSRFAGYVKDNMPFGASHIETQITDDEAWDLAAFVNSQPRPVKDISMDWPNKNTKPFDHPFGPYTDSFSETQHKYGPYGPIVSAKQKAVRKDSFGEPGKKK